ncbi:YhcN/YlaJ family sporulation lipoprotein [Aquisalibacillus elongatus]|uniref:Sporulation lipoprotein YhcN/YlaJ n=1 Tax=Aquisalibacillus elongatus TaxID=485577 RepID=A0A3N5BJS8_9BACI|nr:YhcN/YlaJ family sporulation lipoprotein [Aquisalibacillus elongatus]RPF55510.1 sporulation lipoprotein YhcN/YlaJ [Aquisalibacillus elongatus]
MFKKLMLLISIGLLSACTFVNPDQEESWSDGEQTTDIQLDQKPSTEEKIRYNTYENPYEYYYDRETDNSLGNTDNNDRIRDEEFRERNEQNRQIYYDLRELDEVRDAGVSVQDNQIYVYIILESRSNEEETVEKVKEVVENITDRTDIIVNINEEFHNRIENRKKD